MTPNREGLSHRWPRLAAALRSERAPLDLEIVGRMLLHACAVGAAAGLVGAAFFAALEYTQKVVLEQLAGYHVLRAHGEIFVGDDHPHRFRPWLLALIPAAGALVGGFLTRFAPEARGGGGDQMIRAFHHQGGVVRARVLWVKALASIFTLGSGGAGGREGPTMQIGAALGSMVARSLRATVRERRILMVAGVAAGMAAVFRTPLGAALLAVEVLYRDDFESDALVPAVLASVVSYSIVISIYGESTLFARAPRYPFHPLHLPLYAMLAIFIALVAAGFAFTLHGVERLAARAPVPAWLRPAFGGLALGVFAVPVIAFVGARIGSPGQGLGILGGGYGAAQMAITGSSWLPSGWATVELLCLLGAAKWIASSLTIGSGGSAGDFAPSLVLGGVFGGAFGHVARIVTGDPSIDPGAFALVGMGTFYGGIAHVPVSSLVFVSELAGSYDLLVPLMLAEGIAFVALRNRALYRAQIRTRSESPIHSSPSLAELSPLRVGEVMRPAGDYLWFRPRAGAAELVRGFGQAASQASFPVLDEEGALVGLIASDALRLLVAEGDDMRWAVAADLMQSPTALRADDDLESASRLVLAGALHELPVVDDAGRIIGFLDEAATVRAYLAARAPASSAEP